MTQLPSSWIGCTLNGRYHIESLLGRGGMSTVYRATDPNLQRVVAIKLIHPHLTENPQFVQRFEQEATAVARLRHPNIVQVHDFNHHEGVYYMVLEYIPGETLAQKLETLNQAQAHMLPAQSVRILADLCLAVDYAHQRRMVHRDLKPANVMINRLGEPVLMDFGIAKLLGSPLANLGEDGLGTARYMSPEQIQGQEVDHRADIYALGVMLWEMLTGQPPFNGRSTEEILANHLNQRVPDILEGLGDVIPPALTAVISTALAKDPAYRYQSAADMATTLQTATLYLQELSGPLGARHWQHLSRLLQQAQTAAETDDHLGCLEKLDELERTGADFAPEQVAHLRQAAQTRLYEQAVHLFQSGRFDDSLTLVDRLAQFSPDLPNLEHLETQIRQGQKTASLQTTLDQLYDEAIAHLRQGEYEAALAKWRDVQAQHGRLAYSDRLQVERLAKEGICASLYSRALTAVSTNRPEEALRLWEEIQATDADYPDLGDVAAQAQQLLHQRRQQVTWQRRLLYAVPALLLLGLAAFWLLRGRAEVAASAPMPTATQLLATPQPTQTAVPAATPTAPPTAVPPTTIPAVLPPASPTPTTAPTTEATVVPTRPPNIAQANADASIFASPNTSSLELAVVAAGEQVQVLGRSEVRNWLFVDNGQVAGFIFQPLLLWDGDVAALPVYTYTDAAATPTPPSTSSSAITPLKIDLWGLVGTARCSGGRWSQSVFVQGQGGNGRYRYYWNDQLLAGPISASHTFTVNSGGGVVIGIGRVVSGDGQTAERELFIPIPTCASGS